MTPTRLSKTQRRYVMAMGFYVGIMLAMITYNLFLGIFLGDRSHFWYVLYAISFCSYFVILSTISYDFVEVPFFVYRKLLLASLSAAILVIVIFSRSFLLTSQYTTRGDLLLKTCAAIAIALAVSAPFLPAASGELAAVSRWHVVLGGDLVDRTACASAPWFSRRKIFIGHRNLPIGGHHIHLDVSRRPSTHRLTRSTRSTPARAAEALLFTLALADRVRALRVEREQLSLPATNTKELAASTGSTGLHNRRHFSQRLPEAIAHAEAQGEALSLLLLDVDNFKWFNDTSAIQRVTPCWCGSRRFSDRPRAVGDSACRYGGEEFAVILPGTSAEQARFVAENLRKSFRAESFDVSRKEPAHADIKHRYCRTPPRPTTPRTW